MRWCMDTPIEAMIPQIDIIHTMIGNIPILCPKILKNMNKRIPLSHFKYPLIKAISKIHSTPVSAEITNHFQ